ncbi:MAG TPA: penicillin acylase family protein [Anaeromyxobacteraceae bacterium]|nr:penicillin acylase family protein [Anaeromyxobacteraceae bacterium]
MRPPLAIAAVILAALVAAPTSRALEPLRLPGLHAAAEVVRDGAGIAHVRAADEHDVFFLQGWVHAQDRLFQMDVTRRRASGTLAELLGPGALAGDVQLRTFGLRRAAARSLEVLSPRALAALDAYADGVNAWAEVHPLPPEYAALELTRFAPWTALDSAAVAKLIAFGLSFDLDDVDRTVALASYRQAGAALGFDGTALFFQDLFRAAPFDPASTVPDALLPPGGALRTRGRALAAGHPDLDPAAVELARRWLGEVREEPFLSRLLDRDQRDGSNQWVVSGAFTEGGAPLLASDPHLALGQPSTFYPIHLQAGPFDVIGNSFPGAPAVEVGHNRHVAWGATVDPFDVTDVYQERLVADAASPSGLATLFQGVPEPVIPIPESYAVNLAGDGVLDDVVPVPAGTTPAATLVVPRRNGGPLVQVDLARGVGLSVQYTGFSGTRELDTFLGFDSAGDLTDFERALATFDVGSQNFCYADDAGHIAYFTYSAVPLREDLQRGVVTGLPPAFIRDGTGGNEWIAAPPAGGGAIPYALLPLREFPRLVDPPAGFAVNANNDPAGLTLENDPLARRRPDGGIYYLAPGFDAGFRAGRITQRVRQVLAGGKMTFEAMQSIQADVTMLDAQVLVPAITAAFASARRAGAPAPLAALGADPAVADAVGRLAAWDGSTPTGIPEGYDAADVDGRLTPPTADEIRRSVAATIYAVWRGQLIRNVLDARLAPHGLPVPPGQQAMTAIRHLLDAFPEAHGVGASGIDFFAVPGVSASPEDRRDLVVLESLNGALSLLSGPAFAPAFGGSTSPDDWRWGKLHRIVFAHPMDGPFSVPPALGQFPAPLAGLPGIPRDGGFGVPNASNHDPRADAWDRFMFASGPSNRLVVELSRGAAKRAESVWPGGTSAIPGAWNYLNLLPLWLTDETVPLHVRAAELAKDTSSITRLVP